MQIGVHAGTLPVWHSFVSLEAKYVVLTALKRAEDDGALIFRFCEDG
jgi:alpha-mannosidase